MSSTLPSLDPRLLRVRWALLGPGGGDGSDPSGRHDGPTVQAGRGEDAEEVSGIPRMRAAVALVLRGGAELELLLIKRAVSERDPWSGHMALPGGRLDPSDPSLLDTAVRETREETGILLDPDRRFLGRLDPVSPSTRRLPPLVIDPFVFGAEAGVEAVPEPREVEKALWVPLSHLQDPAAREVVPIRLEGGEIPFPAFVVGGEVVWGLTYRILDRFLDVISRGARGR